MKKLSSVFNIIVLGAAIASIFGFIYFYVVNKVNTPADKDSVHEEILGNLYRNTKYKFRIMGCRVCTAASRFFIAE